MKINNFAEAFYFLAIQTISEIIPKTELFIVIYLRLLERTDSNITDFQTTYNATGKYLKKQHQSLIPRPVTKQISIWRIHVQANRFNLKLDASANIYQDKQVELN